MAVIFICVNERAGLKIGPYIGVPTPYTRHPISNALILVGGLLLLVTTVLKAREELGWKPAYGDLRKIVETARRSGAA